MTRRSTSAPDGRTQVGEHRLEHRGDELTRRPHRLATDTGLAADADAHLDLAVGEVEDPAPEPGRRARGEGDPERARPVVDPPGDPRHCLEIVAALRCGTRDLLDQHGRTQAAPTGGVGDRDVVVDAHGLDGEPLVSRVERDELEVHHLAGVVLHHLEDPGATVGRRGRRDQLVGHR